MSCYVSGREQSNKDFHDPERRKKKDVMLIWLVVWNLFYFPFHIWDVILPIDEVHHFSRW